MNPFRLLEIEPCFNLDLQILDQCYFKKQRKFHPDCVHSLNEKKAAEIQATACNAAYVQLKNPFQRAKAILDYHNYAFDDTKVDPDFLNAFFEWQALGDRESKNIAIKKTELYQKLQQAFERNDFQQAADFLSQWQYLEKY